MRPRPWRPGPPVRFPKRPRPARRLPKTHPGPRLPLLPAAPQPDHSALQARVAAASREGAVGFPAGLSPRRGEEPRPPRGREREASEGLLTGLSEKRQPRARLVLCERRPVPALGAGHAAPASGRRAGGACVREGNASRDPRQGQRRALRTPSPPLPGGGGPGGARSPAPGCPAAFREIGAAARRPCGRSFRARGGERTRVFVHSDLGSERGSCGTQAVYLLPDRVTYTGTHHPSGCQDDPSPGDEFCRCTQNVSPGPPGLGCGAAAGSVSPGVRELPDPRPGGPLLRSLVVPGSRLGRGEA